MVLEFDLGNTYHKWRLLHDSEVISRGQYDKSAGDREALGELLANADIERARIASVASEDAVDELQSWLTPRGLASVFVARSTVACAGVRNIYREPERLGVDRWLALLAAFNQYGAACIVDVGSAVTVDVVDAQGQHLGGYIVPGLRLLQDSLLRNTDRVRWQPQQEHLPTRLGHSTQQCVDHGLVVMLKGFINETKAMLDETHPTPLTWVFTGGGGEAAWRMLGEVGIVDRDLVFNGLAYADGKE